ncbi:methionine--tRNA ligase [Rapidithrix thailandica]|uniref:Methionine--tRNA ligase n=1 Tax=Rapidithrix thailandica TaxID=413964 RepID=A0AAW9RPH4_9BACT
MSEHTYKRYTVTAALPYANGPLHIGHIAGAYLPADIFVRFLREKEQDVAFICGSDEHGAAITIKALKESVTPKDIVDKFHKLNKETFEKFGIAFDMYHRTSASIHHETAQEFFKTLNAKGKFTLKESAQYYDEEAGQYLADRYITGTCPKCHNEGAYGDQCEKCGSSLTATDLINPKSVLSGQEPVLKKTTHWYLPMNEHEAWIKKWIEEGILNDQPHHDPKEWKNHVLGQCKSWIDGGLQPRAMTRDLEWGVKVPLEEANGKVLYVWLDAPIGYISATREWARENGKNWEDYWKKDDTKLIHFIGKDNIVFHCIIFPIILKAHGDGYILPNNVPANEFLNLEGEKISTSRNWAVWLHEYLEDFPEKQDVLRYVLTSIAPENKDSEFTWKDFQARNNNELVAILGNFVNRAMVLTHKYFDGEVPIRGELAQYDREVIEKVAEFPHKIEALIKQYRFKEAQFELMNLARLGNKYLADTEPWKLIKHDPDIVKTVLNIALQITANLGILMRPFLPQTADKISNMLGLKQMGWQHAGKMNILYPYDRLGNPVLLFEKIEDGVVEKQLDKLQKSKLASQPAEPLKEETSFDDFMKMDIRIGTILHAEKVAKTKKLLKLSVDTGVDKRTVVSGIAEYFKPEEIIGKQVCVLANLAPRKIKGIESEGMILMAEDRDGSLSFVSPGQKMNNGSTIR